MTVIPLPKSPFNHLTHSLFIVTKPEVESKNSADNTLLQGREEGTTSRPSPDQGGDGADNGNKEEEAKDEEHGEERQKPSAPLPRRASRVLRVSFKQLVGGAWRVYVSKKLGHVEELRYSA